MKKRVVALLLGMVMIMSTLASCGGKEETIEKETQESAVEESSEESAAEETVEEDFYAYDEVHELSGVQMWTNEWWKQFAGTKLNVAFYKTALDESKDCDDKYIVQAIEELTGIDLVWIPIDSASSDEKVATMLADEANMPDLFMGPLGSSDISDNKDLFADLNAPGMLDTYGKHILAAYEEGGQGLLSLLTHSDGSIRSLAGNMGTDYGSNFGSFGWINKTWCEKVGKEVPTTMDEFIEVLRLFKTEDPNGNGKADEIPFSFNEANSLGLQNLANCFGIGGETNSDYRYWYNAVDGTIKSVCDTDEWREFLEFCHTLIEEGLIDREGFSDTYEQYTSKIATDRIGFFYGWDPGNLQVPNVEDWQGIDPFTIRSDVTYKKTGFLNKSYANLNCHAISATSEHKQAALLVLDLLHSSDEWALASRFARVRGTYDANGRPETGWSEAELAEKFGGQEGNILTYTYGLGESSAYLVGRLAGTTRDTLPSRGEVYTSGKDEGKEVFTYDRCYVYEQYYEYMRAGEGLEVAGTRFTDAKDSAERSSIQADLLPYIRNAYGDFCINGVTDEKWDAFVDGLEEYGYYDWLDWYQRYYSYEM